MSELHGHNVEICVLLLKNHFYVNPSHIGVVVFNGLMHSAFGYETFLYSQHWVAFITFAIVVAIRHLVPSRTGTAILALLACGSAIASAVAWSTMIGHLA